MLQFGIKNSRRASFQRKRFKIKRKRERNRARMCRRPRVKSKSKRVFGTRRHQLVLHTSGRLFFSTAPFLLRGSRSWLAHHSLIAASRGCPILSDPVDYVIQVNASAYTGSFAVNNVAAVCRLINRYPCFEPLSAKYCHPTGVTLAQRSGLVVWQHSWNTVRTPQGRCASNRRNRRSTLVLLLDN